MNISENKRVIALSALFAIAFGGIMYYGYGQSQEYSANEAKLKEISERFEGYSESGVAPTPAALKELDAACAKVDKVNKELQAELSRYASFCYGNCKKISAQDFQNDLRNSIAKIESKAKEKGTLVSAPAADLGLAAFKNAAPVEDDVPFRSFQMKAVERVAEDIINAGAPVLDKIFCAPLPPEAAEAAKGSRKAVPYFPLRFEVAFEANRGNIPQIINSIVADRDFLMTITGVSVKGNESLPGIDAYSAPATAPEGENLGEAAAPAEAEARVVAVRKTGADDEKARVHLTLQVLYFNPAKNK